uniref:C-type lectin domain family 1 member B n=1 Tax=Equus asinus asinus TaxID=83772 RepID=A0A8C4MBW7_EQUAS
MQDEDGYMTLNIETRKPTLTSVDPASSSLWRVMALILLVLCAGMVVGLVALGIMSVTQQNYLQAENENLSRTLQQLAKKFCQNLIRQLGKKDNLSKYGHKCSPCDTNWRYYGDNCYGFFRHNLTWEDSKWYCIDQNATLVKIANQSVLEYIKSRTSLILSGHSKYKHSGNEGENMDCAYFHSGKIHPTFCKNKYYLMCERKAGLAKVDELL